MAGLPLPPGYAVTASISLIRLVLPWIAASVCFTSCQGDLCSRADLPPDVRPLAQLVLHTSGEAQSPQELVADSPRHCGAEPDYTCAASLQ